MGDFSDELDCYRYILKVLEELWKNTGVPEELRKKYEIVKEKSFEKVKSNKMKNDCNFNENSNKSLALLDIMQKTDLDKVIVDEVTCFLDLIFTSNNTLYERISALLSHIASTTYRTADATDLGGSGFSAGLIAENKSHFSSRLKSLKESTSSRDSSNTIKQSLDYILQTQIPRFERIENKLMKNINKIEEEIIKQNGKVVEMEEIIDRLQENEHKFKLEIDILSSKLNQWKQLQSIEQLEKQHELQEQLQMLKESVKKSEMNHEFEIEKLKEYYETIINDLKNKGRNAERELVDTLESIKDREKIRNSRKYEQIDEKLEYSEQVYRILRLEFGPFYDKYFQTHRKSFEGKQSDQKDEISDLIYFIVFLLQKFENDNLWLVDKLTELGNENENLKNKLENEGVLREEFDGIFKKLRTELQESKFAFVEWENSIEGLKKFLDEEKESSATTRRF